MENTQKDPWWDILDYNDRIVNTMRGKDERDALQRSRREAYLIGRSDGCGMLSRFCTGTRAVPTPSGGKHPY